MFRLICAAGVIGGLTAIAAAVPAADPTDHLRTITSIATQRAQASALSAAPAALPATTGATSAPTTPLAIPAPVSAPRLITMPAVATRDAPPAITTTPQRVAALGAVPTAVPALMPITPPTATPTNAVSVAADRERAVAIRSRVAAVRPGDARAEADLVSKIQTELGRVGCYAGPVNGAWNTTTRAAMARFVGRVNARLPVASPDFILLALLRGEGRAVCAAACGAGLERDAGGACVPTIVTAARAERLAFVAPAIAARRAVAQPKALAQTPRAARPSRATPRTVVAKPAKAAPRRVVTAALPKPPKPAAVPRLTTGVALTRPSRPPSMTSTTRASAVVAPNATQTPQARRIPALPARRPTRAKTRVAALAPVNRDSQSMTSQSAERSLVRPATRPETAASPATPSNAAPSSRRRTDRARIRRLEAQRRRVLRRAARSRSRARRF
ncbi:MAG: hypothetical protein AAGG99_05675, partial [Pseudomonadota bacterium]